MGINNKGLILFSLLVSCSNLEEPAIDPGLDYQPLQIGNFWEYHVVETLYFGESDAETIHYFYKDLITSDYFNEAGEQVFTVQRKKSFDLENWQQEKLFTYSIRKGALLKTLDNHTTIPLIFPPKNGEAWNANIYNNQPENTYVINVEENYNMGDWESTSAVKVVQSEEDDLITLRDHRYEVYIKGVGLVESYFEVLTYCSRNDCLGEQIIEAGRFVRLELINNG